MMKEKRSDRGMVPAPGSGVVDEPYEAYLQELDPMGESLRSQSLRLALATSKDPRFQEFLARLSLPFYKRHRLSTIAKGCDISLPEYAQFWQNAQHMRTLLKAQEASFEVTENMIDDAKTKLELCDRCDGFGALLMDDDDRTVAKSNQPIRVCPNCGGKGKVPVAGNTDARKMILEMSGHLGKKGGGAGIAIHQHFGTVESSVDRLRSVSFDVSAVPQIEAGSEQEDV